MDKFHHINLTTRNPHIAFDRYHLQVPQQIETMPRYGASRIAGISGFGFGGTNSHVVLREVSDQERPAVSSMNRENTELFTLSAKNPAALCQFIEKWCVFLENNPALDLAHICYNLHVRRSHHNCRLAIIAHNTMELMQVLSQLRGKSLDSVEQSLSIFINIKKTKPENYLLDSIEN